MREADWDDDTPGLSIRPFVTSIHGSLPNFWQRWTLRLRGLTEYKISVELDSTLWLEFLVWSKPDEIWKRGPFCGTLWCGRRVTSVKYGPP